MTTQRLTTWNHLATRTRDLTPYLQLLAKHQLRRSRSEKIANAPTPHPAQYDAHLAACDQARRIDYLTSFISTLTTRTP